MAWSEFYIQSTNGSNVNAGSTTAAAAVSVANASWDVTAETYIGLSGTEFAAVNVGDWASVYLDAATVAVYIAQVTAVGALGVSITLSTTAKYGTKPASGATGRSCKVGGPHAAFTPWGSTGVGATTVPAATRINIKAETYGSLGSHTFSILGTAAFPVWFRGYNTTPGDCETDPTLATPIYSFSATATLSPTGPRHIWSCASLVGAVSGSFFSPSSASAQSIYFRLRVENTSSNVAAVAWTSAGTGAVHIACWAKCPTTATTTGCWNATGSTALYYGCITEGGGLAGFRIASSSGSRYISCLSLNSAGDGWLATTSVSWALINCTVYNATSDGVEFSTAPTTAGTIIGCAFWVCGGFGINNSSGTNTALVSRFNNSFYSCTGGNENGFGDCPSFFEKQETSQPYTSATDMTPVVGALARATGFPPGKFENQTFRSYVDSGAVQHADPAGPIGRAIVVTNIGTY